MIKFLDLKSQYKSIKSEINKEIRNTLNKSNFVLGPEVEKFEKNFASAHGSKNGIAVNSGTSALHIALVAENIGRGDEVITVPMTFTATVASIIYTGAKPVFVDVDKKTCTIDVKKIEEKITKKTKAIIPVHLYGQPANMDPILAIAKKYDLIVIEDCAQAHLGKYKNKFVGNIGNYGCFSFYPGKNLGAYGEGGIVITNDKNKSEKIRMLRDWGQEGKYNHVMLGFNYRMDGIQGAILNVKLKYLNEWTNKRRIIAKKYEKMLKKSNIEFCLESKLTKHVYHIFSIFHHDRDQLKNYLTKFGIQTGLHYPVPIHLQKAYRKFGIYGRSGDFPVSEFIANNQLSLPIYPELNIKSLKVVVDKIKEFNEI